MQAFVYERGARPFIATLAPDKEVEDRNVQR